MSTRREFLIQSASGLAASTFGLTGASAGAKAVTEAEKRSMKTYKISNTDLVVSRLAYSWATMGGAWDTTPIGPDILPAAERAVHTAFDQGVTLFDHADVYAYGKSESVFGQILKRSPGLRDRIVLQTKCGVHLSSPFSAPPPMDPHRFDFSAEHIRSAVEGSLKRFGTDRIDILLLHRPDPLVEPDEVATAFDDLNRSGKVRYFGLSNHTAAQIELLKKSVRQPLVVNQVQVGLLHPYLITDGLDFDRQGERRLNQTYVGASGLMDYCRLQGIQIQAYFAVRGLPVTSTNIPPEQQGLASMLAELSHNMQCSPFALGYAWLLRHPAGIVPLMGSDKPEHIIENCVADRLEISRQVWYALLYAATGVPSERVL